jgi:hypothetical protein
MTHAEQRRLVTWRSKVLQCTGMGWSVAHTCWHFGISRKTFYKWKKRHADGGAEPFGCVTPSTLAASACESLRASSTWCSA